MGWNVVEEDSYERAVSQIGTHESLDIALEFISYGLHRNPLGFLRTEYHQIFMAKTVLRFTDYGEIIPSYRLWFRVDENTLTVYKLWIDIAPPEDMGYWDEEDDAPF
jgi:hypothetical protein